MTDVMMIVAKTVSGKFSKYSDSVDNASKTNDPVIILPAGVRAPLLCCTADREKLPVAGKAPKNEPKILLKPTAIISCVASIRECPDLKAFATATDSIRPTNDRTNMPVPISS